MTWALALLSVATLAAASAWWRVKRSALRLQRQAEFAAHDARQAEQLREMLRALPTPLLVVDHNADWLSGLPIPERTGGTTVLQLLPAAVHAEFLETLRGAIDSGEARGYRFDRDGHALQADIAPLRSPGLGGPAASVLIRDVSEAEATLGRLRQLAKRNDAILRSSMDGFFVVGDDYFFREVNDAFCRMTGYSSDELLRMRVSELEAPNVAAGLVAPPKTGLHQYPAAHRHKDGRLIFLDISLLVLRDEGQKILVGFARDVTERKRAQEELQRLNRQNKLILDSAAEGICGLDQGGQLTFANPAAIKLLGWMDESPIGKPMHLIVYGRRDNWPCAAEDCLICGVLRGGVTHHFAEGRFTRRDGSRFEVEYSSTPIEADGVVAGAVLVFKDLTERKRVEDERRALESQIQKAQRLESLGLLAGGIAHDFNNILVGVMGNACLAIDQLPKDDPVQQRMEKIIGACQRASKIIHQILAYSGRVTADAHPLDINQLLDEMAEFLRAAVPKSVSLALAPGADLPLVDADHGQMQQVMTNLIINAVEAIGDKSGGVTIGTSSRELTPEEVLTGYPGQKMRAGRYVLIEVRDTGRGMSTDTLARIFEPFFTDKAKGRGLGLAAIRGIIHAHRGGVNVRSRVGEGTVFTIAIPASERSADQAPPSVASRARAEGLCVLVVDDEEEIREVIKLVLEGRGMRVLVAEDGPEGLRLFGERSDDIDVVLLDMTMPGMSGGEVFAGMQRIDPNVRVLLTSGYSEENILARYGPAGAAGFVHKPYTTDTLVEKIVAARQGSAGDADLAQPRFS